MTWLSKSSRNTSIYQYQMLPANSEYATLLNNTIEVHSVSFSHNYLYFIQLTGYVKKI